MCRCLRGCSHAMSNNEEQANEEWSAEIDRHAAVIREQCDLICYAALVEAKPGASIAEALQRIDAASEAILKLGDGPEQPE